MSAEAPLAPFLALTSGEGGATALTDEDDAGRAVAEAIGGHAGPSGSAGMAKVSVATPANVDNAVWLMSALRRLRQRGWRVEGSAVLGGVAAGRETLFLRLAP